MAKFVGSFGVVNEIVIKTEKIVKKYKNGKVALADFDIAVEKGQIVGFVGPNGAGKTTLLKVLSGILQPTSGTANVLGFTPIERKNAFLKKISFLTGTKTQLNWDLPAMDSFDLKRIVYEIPKDEYNDMLAKYTKHLGIGEVVLQPVRTLSLGQRMKCELLHAFLHKPEILFLDEPTLGLDASSQEAVRKIIQDMVDELGSTVILTSHYMEDIEQLADRLVVINEGIKLFDGTIEDLRSKYSPGKRVVVSFAGSLSEDDLASFNEKLMKSSLNKCEISGTRGVLTADRDELPAIVAFLTTSKVVTDFDIVDEAITDLVKRL